MVSEISHSLVHGRINKRRLKAIVCGDGKLILDYVRTPRSMSISVHMMVSNDAPEPSQSIDHTLGKSEEHQTSCMCSLARSYRLVC